MKVSVFGCSDSGMHLLLLGDNHKIMIHTPKIERAIHKAAVLHRHQIRKGKDELPYITHLFSVFVILAEYTEDEDILIAGLLHDTLEDTDYTLEGLERDFGKKVRDIVLGVTEQKTENGVKIDWVERKRGYLQGLENAPEESLYVSAADKIHNFRSILDEYQKNLEKFQKDFNLVDRIKLHGAIVAVISLRLGADTPLVEKLQSTYDEYKSFLEQVK